MDLLKYNRDAWNHEVEIKNKWTEPVDHETIEACKKGIIHLYLTPSKTVPMEWYDGIKGKKILCLASGGGQQTPMLSAAGGIVTVLDNSDMQLNQDRMVAKREGLNITLVQGDMRDLSCFKDESFDLIFHPVSNLFVDDVNKVWKEAYRVLRKGGRLLSGFNNPIVYIFDLDLVDRTGDMRVRYKIPYSDLEQLPKDILEKRMKDREPMEFGHRLEDQIGGQIKAGFSIHGFFEDNSNGDFLDPYIDTFIATLAIK